MRRLAALLALGMMALCGSAQAQEQKFSLTEYRFAADTLTSTGEWNFRGYMDIQGARFVKFELRDTVATNGSGCGAGETCLDADSLDVFQVIVGYDSLGSGRPISMTSTTLVVPVTSDTAFFAVLGQLTNRSLKPVNNYGFRVGYLWPTLSTGMASSPATSFLHMNWMQVKVRVAQRKRCIANSTNCTLNALMRNFVCIVTIYRTGNWPQSRFSR